MVRFPPYLKTQLITNDVSGNIHCDGNHHGAYLERYPCNRLLQWVLILGFIPVLNIMLYTVGYLFYIVHAVWNPDKLSGYTHKFNLRGNNFLTRIVKKIWKFLNVCV